MGTEWPMSTGFPGAYCTRHSPWRKILAAPRLKRILQNKKSTVKHATQQKVKLNSKKAKFAPQFIKIFTSSLSKYGALGALGAWGTCVFGNYWEEEYQSVGAALCKDRLLAESFYFSLLSKTWVDPIQIIRNTPSTYGGSSQGDQHRRTHEGEGLAILDSQPGSIQGRS